MVLKRKIKKFLILMKNKKKNVIIDKTANIPRSPSTRPAGFTAEPTD